MKHLYKDNIDIFDEYFMGEMGEEDQEKFQNQLSVDENLKIAYQEYQDMITVLQLGKEEVLKQKINAIHKKLKEEDFFQLPNSKIITMTANSKQSFRWLAAAAVLLIALGTWYFSQSTTPNVEELMAATSEAKLSTKSSDIATKIIERLEAPGMATTTKSKDDSLSLCLKLYKEDKFEEARIALSDYQKKYPDDDIATAYLGFSLFQQAQYSKAAVHFNKVVLKPDFEYVNTVKWYLALCDFQFKDKNSILQAKSLFEDLYKNADSGYSKEAKFWLDSYFKK